MGKLTLVGETRLKELVQEVVKLKAENADLLKAIDDNWVSHHQLIAFRSERDSLSSRLTLALTVVEAARSTWSISNPPKCDDCGTAQYKCTYCDIRKALAAFDREGGKA